MFFFFKQKTAYEMRISDWSSDVCSSDLVGIGAVAAAGDRQRQRPARVAEAEMQGGEATHRQADDVGGVDAEPVHHRADVVAGAVLAVGLEALRHVGRSEERRGGNVWFSTVISRFSPYH